MDGMTINHIVSIDHGSYGYTKDNIYIYILNTGDIQWIYYGYISGWWFGTMEFYIIL